VVFEIAQPFRLVQFLNPARYRVEEVLVDAKTFRFFLVAKEEIGVLPAVALLSRRLGTVETELLRAFADRVMAVEQLHASRPHGAVDQAGNRAEEVSTAAGALQVVEDLNRDRGIGGTKPVAFLRHAAEYFLRFGDAGDVHDVASWLLLGDVDHRVAEGDERDAEAKNDPDPAPPRDRHDGRLGTLLRGDGGHRGIIAARRSGDPRKLPHPFDTSALGGKYAPTRFQRPGRSTVANHLTPSELAEELHMKRQEVIGKCMQLGIPIFHGRIDKSLFQTSLRSMPSQRQPHHARPS
jgi:hypothetical protein